MISLLFLLLTTALCHAASIGNTDDVAITKLQKRMYPSYDQIQETLVAVMNQNNQFVEPVMWGAFMYGGISLAADGIGICRDCWAEHKIPSNDCEQAVRKSAIDAMVTTVSVAWLARNGGMHTKRELLSSSDLNANQFNIQIDLLSQAGITLEPIPPPASLVKRDLSNALYFNFTDSSGSWLVGNIEADDGTGSTLISPFPNHSNTSDLLRRNYPYCERGIKLSYCRNDDNKIYAQQSLVDDLGRMYDNINGGWNTHNLKMYAPYDNWVASWRFMYESWSDFGDNWEGCDTGS